MQPKFLTHIALALGLAFSPAMSGIAHAQAAPQTGDASVHHHKQRHRNTANGDASTKSGAPSGYKKADSPDARANAAVNSDVQSPNTQNGNQPDRAGAGGGGR